MKRVSLLLLFIMAVSLWAAAGQKKDKNQPAAPAPAPTPLPGTKLPPQAKNNEELKAYQDTSQLKDGAALEKAADEFADKFKTSDLQYLLYYRAMFAYQGENNADKAVEMGKKVLTLSPNEPVTLAMVAEMMSERTRDSDLDRDERLAEIQQDAQKALEKVETDLVVPATATPEQLESNRRMVRSTAYSALGNAQLTKKDYAEAEKNFKLAIDAVPDSPDAITTLRYAISLDHQKKYAQALPAAQRALQLCPAGSPQATMAQQERDRLVKLSAAPAPAAASTPAK